MEKDLWVLISASDARPGWPVFLSSTRRDPWEYEYRWGCETHTAGLNASKESAKSGLAHDPQWGAAEGDVVGDVVGDAVVGLAVGAAVGDDEGAIEG
jgi:hypothetical protein